MKEIVLDGYEEGVKKLIRSLAADSESVLLQMEGIVVGRFDPVPPESNGTATDEAWTPEKNTRRCELIDKEIDSSLTVEEAMELRRLQKEMMRYRQRVAPLPLEDTRRFYKELLERHHLDGPEEGK